MKLWASRRTDSPWDSSRGHLPSDFPLCLCRVWPCTLQWWGPASQCHTWTSTQQTPQRWCPEAGLGKGDQARKIRERKRESEWDRINISQLLIGQLFPWQWEKQNVTAIPTWHIDVCVFIVVDIKPPYKQKEGKKAIIKRCFCTQT